MTIVTKRTFCRFCHAACPLEVDIEDNQIVTIRGVREDPLYEGFTCVKGRHSGNQHSGPERLHESLRRGPGGALEPIPTTQALDEIGDRLRRILDQHGPRAVATYFGTGATSNCAASPVAQAFQTAIGSPSYYTSTTIDQPAKMVVPLIHGIWGAGPQPFSTTDVTLIVGMNTPVSMFSLNGLQPAHNPIVGLRRAKAHGWRLIVIDPRRTELASYADVHLQVTPGEDVTLLAGMVRVILDEELHDVEFCQRWVRHMDELHSAVRAFDLDVVATRTGVPKQEIIAAARLFAAGPRGNAGCGTGPNMAPHGTLMELLVTSLNTLCGRYAREGERMGRPGVLARFAALTGSLKAQPMAPSPEALEAGLPSRTRGLHGMFGEGLTTTLPDEILLPGDGQVRALVVLGGNPAVAWPDQAKTLEALHALDLLVVVDGRVSATARLAHYVIASQLWLERPDIPATMDGWWEEPYTNYTPAVLEPHGDVIAETTFYAELAQRLGVTIQLPGGRLQVDTTNDQAIALSFPNMRIPFEELQGSPGGAIHPSLWATVGPCDPDASGYLDVAPTGAIDELKAVLARVGGIWAVAGFDPAVYRFRLISRRLKAVVNSAGQEIPALREREGTSYAHIHSADLAEFGLVDGDLVELASPRGSIYVLARSCNDLHRGTISMSHAWGDVVGQGGVLDPAVGGASTARLIDLDTGYDPWTGMPVQSAIPVAIRVVKTSVGAPS